MHPRGGAGRRAPRGRGAGDTLNAVAADPATGQAWAVGSTTITGTGGAATFGHQTLTEVYG